jgi:hypothetical protein
MSVRKARMLSNGEYNGATVKIGQLVTLNVDDVEWNRLLSIDAIEPLGDEEEQKEVVLSQPAAGPVDTPTPLVEEPVSQTPPPPLTPQQPAAGQPTAEQIQQDLANENTQ